MDRLAFACNGDPENRRESASGSTQTGGPARTLGVGCENDENDAAVDDDDEVRRDAPAITSRASFSLPTVPFSFVLSRSLPRPLLSSLSSLLAVSAKLPPSLIPFV